MARTRAQQAAEANGESESKAQSTSSSSKSKHGTKRQQPKDEAESERPSKETKEDGDEDVAKEGSSGSQAKVKKLLDGYGAFPLQDTALSNPSGPTADTMLAHLINALLTSTRISHRLAAKTVQTIISTGWTDLKILEDTSWKKKTEVLTQGGYTHYREKTATQLSDLAIWLREKYDGDLNNLLKVAKDEDSKDAKAGVRRRLKEIKGVGEVALDIFCDTAQGLWTELAPFLDPRSVKTAEQMGLPGDVEELYNLAGRDAVEMARLANALTTVRLEKEVDVVAEQ